MGKLFSIVIPTRNRLETAYHAVRSCLHDPSDDYEVIVFDNASEPAVTPRSLELDDPRVKVYRSDQVLPMFLSWETAVSHATGTYVIVIGDDDGLLPSTLGILRPLISEYPGLPIRWARIAYHWPNHPYPIKRNSMKIPLSNAGYLLDSEPVLTGVAHSDLPHFALPMLYNSAVPVAILQHVRKQSGRVFLSTCPDLSSGYAAAYLANRFVSLETPLTIAGISGKSNGMAWTELRKSVAKDKDPGRLKIFNEFMDLSKNHGVPLLHNSLPQVNIGTIITASSFLYVKEQLFPDKTSLKLDIQRLVDACHREIRTRPLAEAKELLETLKQYTQSRPELKCPHTPAEAQKADDNSRVDPMTKPPPRGYDERERILALDTALFKVEDVHAAAILAENILCYKNRGFRLKIKTPKENVIASGRKFLGDLVRRRKVPAFIDCD